MRFDVQRDDVPYDEILADGVASLTGVGASAVHPNGPGGVAEMAAENPPPLTGAVGVEGNGDTGNGVAHGNPMAHGSGVGLRGSPSTLSSYLLAVFFRSRETCQDSRLWMTTL